MIVSLENVGWWMIDKSSDSTDNFYYCFFSRNSLRKFYWAASWFWAVCRFVDTQTRAQASAQAQYPNPHIHPLTQAVTQARVPLLLMSCSPAAEDITAIGKEKIWHKYVQSLLDIPNIFFSDQHGRKFKGPTRHTNSWVLLVIQQLCHSTNKKPIY